MILAIVLAGASVLVVIVVACYIVSGGQEHERKGLIERTMRYIPFQSLKIIIVMWQILTQVRRGVIICNQLLTLVAFKALRCTFRHLSAGALVYRIKNNEGSRKSLKIALDTLGTLRCYRQEHREIMLRSIL